MGRCDAASLPGADALNALAQDLGIMPESGGGRPIRFVAAAPDAGGYERQVFDSGEVHTRPDNWHDFFNALVWLRFPRTKAALNARHRRGLVEAGATQAGTRGALRDAATLFDEDGIVVLSADAALSGLLRRREWKALFWEHRAELPRSMRFVVFGHALYDKLRQPFRGLCGKSVILDVTPAQLGLPAERQIAHIDAELAARWRDADWYRRPAELPPLPVLGIPGVTPDNADPAYYDDRWHFRPLLPA